MTYITYITKLYSQLLVAIVVGLAMLILLPERTSAYSSYVGFMRMYAPHKSDRCIFGNRMANPTILYSHAYLARYSL